MIPFRLADSEPGHPVHSRAFTQEFLAIAEQLRGELYKDIKPTPFLDFVLKFADAMECDRIAFDGVDELSRRRSLVDGRVCSRSTESGPIWNGTPASVPSLECVLRRLQFITRLGSCW